MGSSYVCYKGFGFWSRDSFLESWLGALVKQMGSIRRREAWQDSLIEKWTLESTVDGGVMRLGLDEVLVNDERLSYVLMNAKNALRQTEPLGRRTGELFVNLLEGKLRTNASSPVDYFDG